MTNIIWIGRFPEKVIENTREASDEELKWKVIKIPTRFNKEREIEWKINEFQELIIEIIDRIIDDWIDDFLMYSREKIDDIVELDLRKRELLKHTTKIWDQMFLKSQWIEEAIDLVWNDEEVWVEFKPEYVLWTVEWLLNNYRDRVFKELIRNENKFKNNR